MRLNGAKNLAGKEIEVLVRSSQLQPIVDDLIASDDWALSQNLNELSCTLNETAICDMAPIPYGATQTFSFHVIAFMAGGAVSTLTYRLP